MGDGKIVMAKIIDADVDQSPAGIKAARAYALWHLGDPGWADAIISAYLNPEETMEHLRAAQDDEE